MKRMGCIALICGVCRQRWSVRESRAVAHGKEPRWCYPLSSPSPGKGRRYRFPNRRHRSMKSAPALRCEAGNTEWRADLLGKCRTFWAAMTKQAKPRRASDGSSVGAIGRQECYTHHQCDGSHVSAGGNPRHRCIAGGHVVRPRPGFRSAPASILGHSSSIALLATP